MSESGVESLPVQMSEKKYKFNFTMKSFTNFLFFCLLEEKKIS